MSTIVDIPATLPPAVTDTVRLPGVQTIPLRLPDSLAVPRGERFPLLDLLRVLAAHLVVWHHLSFYGPVSTVAYEWLPGPIWALSEWGRCAVQTFFVIGGFVMARSLSQRGWISLSAAGKIVARRYRRIGGPYVVLLLIAVVANAVAGYWMDHPSISGTPTVPQLLAHVVFLHDILGYEPLTAGIWYLAIDFQLCLLLLGLTMLAQRLTGDPQVGRGTWSMLAMLLIGLATASLFWFNRDAAWEKWAVYFVGSYGLGVMIEGVLSGRLPKPALIAYVGLMLLALIIEWRLRLAVGMMIGLLIACGGLTGMLSAWPRSRFIEAAANQSYSLFLIHFPVCLIVNALWSQFALGSPLLCLAGMGVGYGLSIVASALFCRHVERAFC